MSKLFVPSKRTEAQQLQPFLGKSLHFKFEVDITYPVNRRGAMVCGLDWPLATKYGKENPDPERKLMKIFPSSELAALT